MDVDEFGGKGMVKEIAESTKPTTRELTHFLYSFLKTSNKTAP